MPNKHADAQQQYDAVENLLERWLKERRLLLTRYTQVATVAGGPPSPEVLKLGQSAFCDVLVDYVSAGHFEVYVGLLDEAECFGDGSGAVAADLMPAISDTTEFILAYEEKYAPGFDDSTNLERDLSAVGEMLETRFELEDRLISKLHRSHRRQLG